VIQAVHSLFIQNSKSLALLAALLIVATCWIVANGYSVAGRNSAQTSIGVLYPFHGEAVDDAAAVVDTIKMAVEEINENGGLLGRQIGIHVVRPEAGTETFSEGLRELVGRGDISAIFGGGTSAERKSLLPILEPAGGLLFYTGRSEGLEHSPSLVYTSAAPNQDVIPIVEWALGNLGDRIILIGSDSFYSRVVHEIIGDYLEQRSVGLVGQFYLGHGGESLESAVQSIAEQTPDVILNTLPGPLSSSLARALRSADIRSSKSPTINFGLAHSQRQVLQHGFMVGDYVASSYFESVDSPANREFVKKIWSRIPDVGIVTSEMQSAYVAVRLWAAAVRDAKSFNPMKVHQSLADQSISAPEGIVYLDSDTYHLWKTARLARIQLDSSTKIVWTSANPIRPHPFPRSRYLSDWQDLLDENSDARETEPKAPQA